MNAETIMRGVTFLLAAGVLALLVDWMGILRGKR